MSRTLDAAGQSPDEQFLDARETLFSMVSQGRSFSGRERNCCFLNTRDGSFANVSAIAGVDFPDDGRALAVVDWDQDGDLDVFTTNRNAPRLRFLRNDVPSGNNHLTIALRGNGRETSRDAIGARVEVLVDGLEGIRLAGSLRAGEGFLSQSSKWLHFGLGPQTQIQSIVVEWPGGAQERFAGIAAGRRYILHQGTATAEPVEARGGLKIDASSPQPPPAASQRMALARRVPMPSRSGYRNFQGPGRRIDFDGRPLLINLWASWCAPCLSELQEFTDRAEEIRRAGLDVLALSVDHLSTQPSGTSHAAATAQRLGFTFATGLADESFAKTMQGYHNQLVALSRPLPVPSSFLVDGNGRLAAIYKGPVSVEQLLSDVAALEQDHTALGAERFLPGRLVDDQRAAMKREEAWTRSQFNLAYTLQLAGQTADAVAHFEELVKADAGCGPAWAQMAVALESEGSLEQALAAYARALELDPDAAKLHYNRANALARLGRLEEALDGYRRTSELDEGHAEAHVNRGAALVRLQRYDEALQAFRQAAAVRPDFAPALENLRRLEAFLESREASGGLESQNRSSKLETNSSE